MLEYALCLSCTLTQKLFCLHVFRHAEPPRRVDCLSKTNNKQGYCLARKGRENAVKVCIKLINCLRGGFVLVKKLSIQSILNKKECKLLAGHFAKDVTQGRSQKGRELVQSKFRLALLRINQWWTSFGFLGWISPPTATPFDFGDLKLRDLAKLWFFNRLWRNRTLKN